MDRLTIILDFSGIILGSLGSIGGILWIRDKIIDRLFRKRFKLIFNLVNKQILIVTPTQENHGNLPFFPTTFEDSMAQSISMVEFYKYDIKTEVKLHQNINEDNMSSNLFLICGPGGNTITKKFLTDYDNKLPFNFKNIEHKWIISDKDAETRYASNTDQDKIDFGLLIKINNPLPNNTRETRKIYICTGIRGFGTWGTTLFLFMKINEFYNRLNEEGIDPSKDNFCAVIKSHKHLTNEIETSLIEVKKF
jgi:hypothetical protein